MAGIDGPEPAKAGDATGEAFFGAEARGPARWRGHMRSMIADPNSLVLTSVASSMRRAKS